MLKKIKHKDFFLYLVGTILLCTMISLYCAFYGQNMPLNLDAEFIAMSQIYLAIVLTIIFSRIKHTRKPFWFSIPAILVAFSIVYFLVG